MNNTIKYNLAQNLTDAQKLQARNNISAQASGDYATNERVTNAVDALNEADSDLKDFIDDLQTQVNDKQDELVSGTNIKTINGNSLLGKGNISISTTGTNTSASLLIKVTKSVTSGSSVLWDGQGCSNDDTTKIYKGNSNLYLKLPQVSYDFVGRLFLLGHATDQAYNFTCNVSVSDSLINDLSKPVHWGHEDYSQLLGGVSKTMIVCQEDMLCSNGLSFSNGNTASSDGTITFEFYCNIRWVS